MSCKFRSELQAIINISLFRFSQNCFHTLPTLKDSIHHIYKKYLLNDFNSHQNTITSKALPEFTNEKYYRGRGKKLRLVWVGCYRNSHSTERPLLVKASVSPLTELLQPHFDDQFFLRAFLALKQLQTLSFREI